ncbi:MAG: hypothetical protein ACO28P_01390 [Ilumatobacteraceae bacterium]
MIPSHLLTTTVTLAHRVQSGFDSYHQPTHTITTEDVPGYYRPRRANTVVSGGEVEKSDESVIINAGPVLTDLDHVIVDGETFRLDGEPMNHWNPLRSQVEYVRIDLRRGVN